MDAYERDETPMLDKHEATSDKCPTWTRSASLSVPTESAASFHESSFLGHTGPLRSERRTSFIQMSGPLYIKSKFEDTNDRTPEALRQQDKAQFTDKYSTYDGVSIEQLHNGRAEKNEHLLKSGQLGMCNDPYCTTCPSCDNYKVSQGKFRRTSDIFDMKFHNVLYGDAKGWARRLSCFLCSHIPGVMNPHNEKVQWWNKFFVISCLVAIFLDPLFFFLLFVFQDSKCIVIDEAMTNTMVFLRSITDTIYLFHMLLQQISTLAGNLVSSYFVWEVLFTMAIIGLGLLLFALLIGNMQNFLQSLGRRKAAQVFY